MLFCPLPWIFQAFRNNGDVRVCCQANQGPDRGLIRKDDGTVYNGAVDDLVECRNAQKMKDIRVAMLNDKWHPDCIRCEREEASGMTSRFTYEEILWADYIKAEDAMRMTKPDGTIDTQEVPVVYYDMRFGNLCQLKCRSCGPTDSSAWYEDQVKVWGDTYFDTVQDMKLIKIDGKYQPENDIYNWYESETFWNHMHKEIPNILHTHIIGGEPFLIKQHFDFLEKCIELGNAHRMTIEHNSNIIYIPSKAWELWKHFKAIRIGASMDGIGKVNDYIRYPSKWKKFEENLWKLERAEGNIKIWLAVTVQAFNILHLPEIFQWKMDQNFKNVNCAPWQPIVALHPLHAPNFSSAKVFPLKVKEAIKDRLDKATFTKDQENARKLLDQYTDFMFKDDFSPRFDKFWEYNNKLDEVRGQKLEDYIPDLYELIKEYKP